MPFSCLVLLISSESCSLRTYSFQVFSAFGTVQKIAMFEKNGQTQALIQYPGERSPMPPLFLFHISISGSVKFFGDL